MTLRLLTAIGLLLPLIGCKMIAAEAAPTEAQAILPPASPWRGASEALIVGLDHAWITPTERSRFVETPNYVDTVAWLKKLAAASPLIELQTFGRTPEGRDLALVVASRKGARNPVLLKANGLPTLLVQAGIHSGEIDGKDAGMMLLRDIAFGGKAHLLDQANLLFIPVLNADGHERASEWNRPNQRGPRAQGWRTTAQNLNLNRDYVKIDTIEMQALLQLLSDWEPDLYLDVHVTDGIDYQYDITYGFHGWDGTHAWSPQIGNWLDNVLRPAIDDSLFKAGHTPGPLIFAANRRDIRKGIKLGPYNPRFSSGYSDLRHLAGVLIENHSLKPFRQRVLGTYVLLEASLSTLGQHADDLRKARAEDSHRRPAVIPANWIHGGGKTARIDFLGIDYEEYESVASGSTEVRWLGTAKTYPDLPLHWGSPGVELRRPKAYWVSAAKPGIIDRLRRHGVKMEPLKHVRKVDAEMYRLIDPQPSSMPYEGRHIVKTSVRSEQRHVIFPSGSVRIPTDQPLGDLVVLLMEPASVDSFFAWGLFPEALQRTEYIEGYVIAPLAEKMLAEDAGLKAEFEAKLAGDKAFAADPRARLQWFYQRSKFYDDRYLLYPVGIER